MKKTLIIALTVVLGLIAMLILASAYDTLGFGKTLLFGIGIGLVEFLILAYFRD